MASEKIKIAVFGSFYCGKDKSTMRTARTRRSIWPLINLVLGMAIACPTAQAQSGENDDFGDKLMLLGAGPEAGSLGTIGSTLCETLNAARKSALVRCVLVQSAGSVFNIHAAANGSLQLGLGQEQIVNQVYGNSAIKGGSGLRTVAILHSSPISIMVRKASGITDLSQIRQRVVNIDIKGSGIHFIARAMLQAMNFRESDFADLTFLPPATFTQAFCEGKMDVIFSSLAQPSEQHRKMRACGGEFLDIPADLINKMAAANVRLRPLVIPAGLYDPAQREVRTAGTRYLLVTHRGVDEEAISRVATQIARQNKTLQASQPIFASLVPMTQDDVDQLVVPLHPGAMRAFRGRAQ